VIVSFRDLQVYQESFQLQIEIEDALKTFPPDERFLLSDQMRRCCRGIPAIIAEGYSRRESIKEFQKYLRDASGEANEMINHLMLAKHKGYIKPDKVDNLISRYEVLAKKLVNLKNNWQNFKSKDQEVK
jgi:four helix bundle protein